jgi:hypothetical protein
VPSSGSSNNPSLGGFAAWRLSFLYAAMALALAGCERGCAGKGMSLSSSTGAIPQPAVDCPDGLARCEEGAVSVSRLATLPVPCRGAAGACTCPWEALAACPRGCAADGVEVVVERARATSQLCAPESDAGAFAGRPWSAMDAGESPCEEGDRYRCAAGRVIDCEASAVGLCPRGCFAEGTAIDDDGVNREAAFAILCSR